MLLIPILGHKLFKENLTEWKTTLYTITKGIRSNSDWLAQPCIDNSIKYVPKKHSTQGLWAVPGSLLRSDPSCSWGTICDACDSNQVIHDSKPLLRVTCSPNSHQKLNLQSDSVKIALGEIVDYWRIWRKAFAGKGRSSPVLTTIPVSSGMQRKTVMEVPWEGSHCRPRRKILPELNWVFTSGLQTMSMYFSYLSHAVL